MLYTLEDLLSKMGTPEVEEKGAIKWNCGDGFAEIKLIENGKRLVAEQKQVVNNYEDEMGNIHDTYIQNFYLHAERQGTYYKVTKVAFDGNEYQHPTESMIELGTSIFHSRALTISILMLEQNLNKQDIVTHNLSSNFELATIEKSRLRKQEWGVVIPFPAAKQERLSA